MLLLLGDKSDNSGFYRMQLGDLVWFCSYSGLCYIRRIISDWLYRDNHINLNAHIENVLEAEIYKVCAVLTLVDANIDI